MSLLIFIAESHDMHPKGVPCRKWGVKCSNDQEKYGRKAVRHSEGKARRQLSRRELRQSLLCHNRAKELGL